MSTDRVGRTSSFEGIREIRNGKDLDEARRARDGLAFASASGNRGTGAGLFSSECPFRDVAQVCWTSEQPVVYTLGLAVGMGAVGGVGDDKVTSKSASVPGAGCRMDEKRGHVCKNVWCPPPN